MNAMMNNAEQDKHQRLAQWWDTEGKAMWDARISIGQFLGEEAFVIRFACRDEMYMPLVLVRQDQAGQGKVTLTIGGLIGRSFKTYEGGTAKSISTYSSSDRSAATLEEALYDITH